MTDHTADAWEALHRAQITVTRRLQTHPEFTPVTYREFDVLDLLSRHGHNGIRQNRLNDDVPLTQSSLSRMIDRLVARGFVHKWQDPDDLRGLRIRLTDHGRDLHTTIAAQHHDHLHDIMSGALTDDELVTLTRLTDKLRTHTQDNG